MPYDGKLIKADGKGTWCEGLDPQELYAQNEPNALQVIITMRCFFVMYVLYFS